MALCREKCYADYVRLRWRFTHLAGLNKRTRRTADRRATEGMLVLNGMVTVIPGASRSRTACHRKS